MLDVIVQWLWHGFGMLCLLAGVVGIIGLWYIACGGLSNSSEE